RRGGLAAEHELRIAEHGNGTGPVGIVADGDARDADGLVARHEHGGVTRETAVLVAETRVAETVTDLVPRGCGCRAGRQGVIRAGLVIADPERLAVRIGDRVVEPRRQAILAAVRCPGVDAAAL